MRSTTETLIAEVRKLSNCVRSTDIPQRKLWEVADRLEEQQRTLRVIRTWAEFYRESPAEHATTLIQIRDKCDQVLDLKGNENMNEKELLAMIRELSPVACGLSDCFEMELAVKTLLDFAWRAVNGKETKTGTLAIRHFEVVTLRVGECEGCTAVELDRVFDEGDVVDEDLTIEVLDEAGRGFHIGQLVTVAIYEGLFKAG